MKTPVTVRFLTLPVGLLLIACTVAVWTLPRPATTSGDPCDVIAGPARTYCLSEEAVVPEPAREDAQEGAAAPSRAGEHEALLLMFSTAALGSGIALAAMSGRSAR
ncbi:hypothetical protein [Streptomyces sp. NPDC001268]|uniref:hypothetical protein n=1 Tax=Streptomyces sp. NPDC001268 TaxID=3364553 RepID=UPI0036CA5595